MISNDDQRKQLCVMLHRVFVEIRALSWAGKNEQAGDLADAFHNLPVFINSDNFSWDIARMCVESYYAKYPRPMKGDYRDYLSLLDEIENSASNNL